MPLVRGFHAVPFIDYANKYLLDTNVGTAIDAGIKALREDPGNWCSDGLQVLVTALH